MQFMPEDWVYTYFRYDDKQTVMIVMNSSADEKKLDVKRYAERTKNYTKAKNIVSQSVKDISGEWTVPGKTIWIMELSK